MDITDPIYVSDRHGWRSWLRDNHDTEKGCWLMYVNDDGRNISYLDAVEEAICFGWIDSTMKKIDDMKRIRRFTPRKKNSHWTELNKERARRLIRIGSMTLSGLKAHPDLDYPFVPDERIIEELRKDSETYENFLAFPDLYVRIRLGNISSYGQYEEMFWKKVRRFTEYTKQNRMYGEWNDRGRLL